MVLRYLALYIPIFFNMMMTILLGLLQDYFIIVTKNVMHNIAIKSIVILNVAKLTITLYYYLLQC